MTRRGFLKLSGSALLFCSMTPMLDNALAAQRTDAKIPVLLYHDIAHAVRDDYTVSPSAFAVQMEWLYANGYKTLSFDHRDAFLNHGSGKAVMITFDDGYTSFMDYAFPLLKEYGFKATVNIIGKATDNHALLNGQNPVLSWDECRYLLKSGVADIGCHSYALHTFAPRSRGGVLSSSYKAIEKDLMQFQERYEKELGKPCATIAWPYGIYDAQCVAIARKAGFARLLTSHQGYLDKTSSPAKIPRLNINGKLDLGSFQKHIGAIV